MPGYTAPTYTTFGRNEYLRSTVGLMFESYTAAASTIPADASGNKVLQSGTVLAKITSGGDTGKVGPFSATATDGRQTAANIVGICDSFFPYQMGSTQLGSAYGAASDREVAVLKAGRVVGAALYEYTSTEVSPGTRGISGGTKTALIAKGADLNLLVY